MNRGLTDAELIGRAREGDLDAFDRLVARHRVRVYGIARHTAGDPEAAQDIAQEAFLNAFRALGTLRAPFERFGPWLNTIVRREAWQWLRGGRRRPEPLDGELVRGMPGLLWHPDPEPPTELVERVRSALASLPHREREVMVLHYLEGRSCEEIATRLHRSLGAVKRLLHQSRNRARKECEKMETAGHEPGPRHFDFWIDGHWAEHLGRLRPSLAQSICLAVNKEPKTAERIGGEVGAHPAYVRETAEGLVEMEALVEPGKNQYVAGFIAFDAADWRRLMSMIREPAAKVAAELAKSVPRMRAAFERTPLAAAGWTWERVIWPVYATLVVSIGASRNSPETHRPARPEHPGGYRYWLGGRETRDDLPVFWNTGFNCSGVPVGIGYFWSWGLTVPHPELPRCDTVSAVVRALADGPLSEDEALCGLGEDKEDGRGILAGFVRVGLIERRDATLRFTIPVFTRGDSDGLTPEIDAVISPVLRDIAVPAFSDVDRLLDEMGYRRHREHYPQWHRWLIGDVMGEALRFMMEQGVLPRLDESTPPTFGLIGWKEDLPLMSWGV